MGEQNWYAVHDLINFFFIIWKKIIAVIDATPLQLRKESLKNCAHNCDDLLSYYSSPRSPHIWFPYIHNFIIILLQVYNEPIQRPAPSWIVSSDGRALHRYRRGKGSESRTSLNFFFFFTPCFRNFKSCVYNCDNLLSYNSSPRSSHVWFSYFHNFLFIIVKSKFFRRPKARKL